MEDIGAPAQLRSVGRVVEVFPDGTSQLELQRPPHGAFGFSVTSGHGRPDTGTVGSPQSLIPPQGPAWARVEGVAPLLLSPREVRWVGGRCHAQSYVSISAWLGTRSPRQRLFITGLFPCSPWAPRGQEGLSPTPAPSAGVYVQEMADAGTAKLYAGLLGVGDEILQVNGAAVSGLGLARIRQLLLQADTVTLRVLRHRPAPR